MTQGGGGGTNSTFLEKKKGASKEKQSLKHGAERQDH